MNKLKPSRDPIIGKVLNERYRILDLMGVGKFSVVYRAHHLFMDRTVALKTLKFELVEDERIVKRFEKEAIVLSKLRHPNIVTVFDCFVHTTGQPFLVMDFLDGVSLEELIRNKGPVPARLVKPIMIQASAGLSHAHQNGILHRDVKPENIVLLPKEKVEERVRLLDFGFALVEGDITRLTKSGTACGSPAYMSPERWRGQEMDVRSDIYSLGIVMYEALTGQVPFKGKSLEELREQHVSFAPAPVASIRRELAQDAELQRIIDRALAKDPELRFSSMRDFQAHLKRWQPLPDELEDTYLAGDGPFATRPKPGEKSSSQALLVSNSAFMEGATETLEKSAEQGEIQAEVLEVVEQPEVSKAVPELNKATVECETGILKPGDLPIPPPPVIPELQEKPKIVPEIDRRRKSNSENGEAPQAEDSKKAIEAPAGTLAAPKPAEAAANPLPPAKPLANSSKAVLPMPSPQAVPKGAAPPESPLTRLASELSEKANSQPGPPRSPLSGILSPTIAGDELKPAPPKPVAALAASTQPQPPAESSSGAAKSPPPTSAWAGPAQSVSPSENTVKLEQQKPGLANPSAEARKGAGKVPPLPTTQAASGEWHPLPGKVNMPSLPPLPEQPIPQPQKDSTAGSKSGITARVEAALTNRAPEGDGLLPHELVSAKHIIEPIRPAETRESPPVAKAKAPIGPSYLDRQLDEQKLQENKPKRDRERTKQALLVPGVAAGAVLIGIALVVCFIMMKKAPAPAIQPQAIKAKQQSPTSEASKTPVSTAVEKTTEGNSQVEEKTTAAARGATLETAPQAVEPAAKPVLEPVKKHARRKPKRRKTQSSGGYIEVPVRPGRRAYQTY